MKRIIALAVLAISLVAVSAVIGIPRMNSSVPSAEATHLTAVIILGCGPTKDHSTYVVERYNGSVAAPASVTGVTIGETCTEALVALTDQGMNFVGKASGAFTHGDGLLYTLIDKNAPDADGE